MTVRYVDDKIEIKDQFLALLRVHHVTAQGQSGMEWSVNLLTNTKYLGKLT